MTRTTKHFFGALTAVLLAVGLAALVLMAFAASAADAQPSGGRQPAQAKDEGTDQAEDQQTPEAEDQQTPKAKDKVKLQGASFIKVIMADSPSGKEANNHAVTVTAKCPEGYVATGGGFDVHREWYVFGSFPAVDAAGKGEGGWRVVAAPYDKNPFVNVDKAKPFTAYAVCAAEELVPGIWYDSAKGTLPKNQTQDVVARCGNTGKAIGGGYRWTGGPGTFRLARTQPNYGNDLRSWLVTAKNDDPNNNSEFEAHAVCVPDSVPKRLEPQSSFVRDSRVINSNSPSCPNGTYLLGGGVGVPNDQAHRNNDWSHNRPSGGDNKWSVGVWSSSYTNINLYSIAMCGGFDLDQQQPPPGANAKTSANNPGGGDSEGGGRSKKGDEA